MLKRILKIIGIFIIGMVGGIFADQIFWPYFIERPLFYQYRLEPAPVYVTEEKKIYIQENVALKNAVEKVEQTVVGVRSKTKTGKILEGSGVILTSDGLAITLAELAPQDSEINIFWEEKIPAFQILKRDLKNNLALIKIEEKNLPTTGFADLEKLKLGERIFLVGTILTATANFGLAVKKTVNEGIVKNLNQNLIETNILEKGQLSGSPLFNIEGSLLGLNTIDKEGNVSTIPISKIKSLADL